uniref:patatin-like phospholipase domain-containing protein 4 isoform X2 n=1 Tax=Oncorhynchus gorbuscha TaxID=8017 RepID=UPI001EAEA333|nr:patatin-like phospholipase domain-containing protein 4 isoform X2 [Oncorhynchus gorbuscha]
MTVPVVNLSFAACGFLGIYQLGACGAILRHGDKLMSSLRACAGASAGALVAAVMVTAPDKLQVRWEGIEEFLPGNAHIKAGNRLHISITHSKSGKNTIVSSFASREDLIKALLASSFVPVYAGIKPVEWQGQKWIDGGFTDSLPILPEGRTITVSPFAGPQDICPKHRGLMNLHLKLANMDVMFSKENIIRLNQSLFPPLEERMNQYCKEGHDDAVRFLKNENWIQ